MATSPCFVGTLPFHPHAVRRCKDKAHFDGHSTGEWMVSKVARELGVNATGGSSSVKDAWEHLRLAAAATAKASLLLVCCKTSGKCLSAKELIVKDGVSSRHISGKSAQLWRVG